MVSKGVLLLSCHGAVWVGALALALWAGAARAAVRYDTATPYTPPYNYKYIPIGNSNEYDAYDPDSSPAEDTEPSPTHMPVSTFILTALRTVLDVVRNMNKQRAAAPIPPINSTALSIKGKPFKTNGTAKVTGRGLQDSNNTVMVSARGFDDYYDEHHHVDTTTAKPMKGRYTDPWQGYYDWIINEGSFKFWSVFQLFTAALLLYACLSAIYYAKFNPIIPDYDREYDDYFLERTVGRKARSLESWELPSGINWMNPRMFQFIMDAISSHYEEQ